MPTELDKLTRILIEKYVRFTEGNMILLYDDKTRQIQESIIDAVDMSGSGYVDAINIDTYRKDKSMLEIPKEMGQRMHSLLGKIPDPQKNVLLYIFHTREGEVPFRKQLVKEFEPYGKVGGLPRCTLELLKSSYIESYNPDFPIELEEFLSNQPEIIIKDTAGTNLKIEFDASKFKFVRSDGIILPHRYGNPIPAEVYTYPANIEGKAFIRSLYAPFLDLPEYSDHRKLIEELNRDPLVWTIKNGEIISVQSKNESLGDKCSIEVFERDPVNGRKIGEVGHAANMKGELTGDFASDEKKRIHIANGDAYKKHTHAPYESKVHADGLMINVTLYSPKLGKNYMINDKYNPEVFKTLRK